MYWYGIEPLIAADPRRALELALDAEIPRVRQFIARRVVDDAAATGDKGDLPLLVAALAVADEKVRPDLLKGARDGIRGRDPVRGCPGCLRDLGGAGVCRHSSHPPGGLGAGDARLGPLGLG